MRLLLVRHGQTDYHDPKRAQGWADIPLNATGRAQAAALGKALEGEKIDRVIVSPLGRAQETARAVGRPYETDPRLKERNYGEWEGRDFKATNDVIAEDARSRGVPLSEGRPPGGESLADVWTRMQPVIEELRRSEGTTLIVAHGGVVGTIVAELIRATPETIFSFHLTSCSITELEFRPDAHFLLKRLSEPPSDDPIFRE